MLSSVQVPCNDKVKSVGKLYYLEIIKAKIDNIHMYFCRGLHIVSIFTLFSLKKEFLCIDSHAQLNTKWERWKYKDNLLKLGIIAFILIFISSNV